MKTVSTRQESFVRWVTFKMNGRGWSETYESSTLASDATFDGATEHGQMYRIVVEHQGPTGTATIRSIWIIRFGEEFPRFVSAYPD